MISSEPAPSELVVHQLMHVAAAGYLEKLLDELDVEIRTILLGNVSSDENQDHNIIQGGEMTVDQYVQVVKNSGLKTPLAATRRRGRAPPANTKRSASTAGSPNSGRDTTAATAKDDQPPSTRMKCSQCGSRETPQWRYIHTDRYCNACYMRVKRWVESKHVGEKLPSRSRQGLTPQEDAELRMRANHFVQEAFAAAPN